MRCASPRRTASRPSRPVAARWRRRRRRRRWRRRRRRRTAGCPRCRCRAPRCRASTARGARGASAAPGARRPPQGAPPGMPGALPSGLPPGSLPGTLPRGALPPQQLADAQPGVAAGSSGRLHAAAGAPLRPLRHEVVLCLRQRDGATPVIAPPIVEPARFEHEDDLAADVLVRRWVFAASGLDPAGKHSLLQVRYPSSRARPTPSSRDGPCRSSCCAVDSGQRLRRAPC